MVPYPRRWYDDGVRGVGTLPCGSRIACDRYREEQTVRYFRGFLWTAWEQIKGPHESTLIPSWNRVVFSMPEIQAHLIRAVEEDNA